MNMAVCCHLVVNSNYCTFRVAELMILISPADGFTNSLAVSQFQTTNHLHTVWTTLLVIVLTLFFFFFFSCSWIFYFYPWAMSRWSLSCLHCIAGSLCTLKVHVQMMCLRLCTDCLVYYILFFHLTSVNKPHTDFELVCSVELNTVSVADCRTSDQTFVNQMLKLWMIVF